MVVWGRLWTAQTPIGMAELNTRTDYGIQVVCVCDLGCTGHLLMVCQNTNQPRRSVHAEKRGHNHHHHLLPVRAMPIACHRNTHTHKHTHLRVCVAVRTAYPFLISGNLTSCGWIWIRRRAHDYQMFRLNFKLFCPTVTQIWDTWREIQKKNYTFSLETYTHRHTPTAGMRVFLFGLSANMPNVYKQSKRTNVLQTLCSPLCEENMRDVYSILCVAYIRCVSVCVCRNAWW